MKLRRRLFEAPAETFEAPAETFEAPAETFERCNNNGNEQTIIHSAERSVQSNPLLSTRESQPHVGGPFCYKVSYLYLFCQLAK